MKYRLSNVGLAALLAALSSPATAQTDFVASWLAMVEHSQAEQPRWITPIATVTPRLEQEIRLDGGFGTSPNHTHLSNYGGGKGVEFIPTENTEVFFGIPPYETRTSSSGATLAHGWGDWTAFLIKYRFLTSPEDQGNYVASAFFQMSAPIGSAAFTNRFYVLQPTISFGKGWGDFDIQTTVSEQFAAWGSATAGKNFGAPVLVNVAAQYHVFDILWPEVELNSTWWPSGARKGEIQTYVTPAIIFGRFPVHDRVRLIFGAGYQIALSPRTPTFRDNVVLTVRTTF